MAKPIVTPKNSNTKLHVGVSGASVRKETGTIAQGVRNSNARLQSSVQRPEPTAMQRAPGNRGLNSERLRSRMVERIMEYGVTDSVVLDAMRQVPRHLFVDEALASRAYDDMSLPIGAGQTISQPWIVAHMIALARNGKPLRKVLEIGTGCGYQAAVLSQVAKTVYSIERVELLYHLALTHLQEFGVDNVYTFLGDGMQGLVKDAPFDAIILAAAGLEVPPTLLNQLKIGGRLLAPVGGKEQRLILIERTGSAQWDQSYLEDVHFVPLLPGIYR